MKPGGRRIVLALLLTVACAPTGDEGVTSADDAGVDAAAPDSITVVAAGPERGPVAAAGEAAAGGFPHEEHGSVACRSCHGTPQGHEAHDALACGACHQVGTAASNTVSNAASAASAGVGARCASCHHASGRADCARCHDGAPVAARQVTTGTRTLPFAHPRHEDIACTRCHVEGPTLSAAASCASCHERHHTQISSCVACHDAAVGRAAVHVSERVHLGCGGAGCHTDTAVLALDGTRNLCLTCHAALTEHEPGAECQKCHLTRIGVGGRP